MDALQPKVGAVVALVPMAYCRVPPEAVPAMTSSCADPVYVKPLAALGYVDTFALSTFLTVIYFALLPASTLFIGPAVFMFSGTFDISVISVTLEYTVKPEPIVTVTSAPSDEPLPIPSPPVELEFATAVISPPVMVILFFPPE